MGRLRRAWDAAKREIGVYQHVLRDPRTPRFPKFLLGLAVAYLVSPIDLIPDCIPVLGHLDDLVVVPGLVGLALWFVPKEVVADARRAVGEDAGDDPP